jgi:hypothetical protein
MEQNMLLLKSTKKTSLSSTFKWLFCAYLSISGIFAYAQSCGTVISKEYLQELQNLKAKVKNAAPLNYSVIPKVNLSITLYFLNGDIAMDKMEKKLDSLNTAFEPTGISFSICDTFHIYKGAYDLITSESDKELTSLYHKENTINLYLANNLSSGGEAVCGYTYLTTKKYMDFIFVDKESCNISKTLIHEMGHLFGLLHPHETIGGHELVDGSNCHTAGDEICDTEASPNLKGLVNQNCIYIGNLVDANGDYYLPTVSNYMSYSLPRCLCKFTPGQYKLMIEFYRTNKSYLR